MKHKRAAKTIRPLGRIHCGAGSVILFILFSRLPAPVPALSSAPATSPRSTQVEAGRPHQGAQRLKAGQTAEHDLAAGQTGSWLIALKARQRLSVSVKQHGIDAVVSLYSPTGRKLVEENSVSGADGQESLRWIAEEQGDYRLELRPAEAQATPGRCEVKVEELRQATQSERLLFSASLLVTQADGLISDNKYQEAVRLMESAEAICRKPPIRALPDTAGLLNLMAVTHHSLGSYKKALALLKQAIEIRERYSKQQPNELAQTLNNLALLYSLDGDYVRAEPLLRRAIKIMPADHPEQATYLNSLAGLYRVMGRYREAEPLFKNVLEIRRKSSSPDEPSLAQALNNLGDLYLAWSEYAKAEPLLLEAASAYDRAIEKMPEADRRFWVMNYAGTLNNLATLYLENGDGEKAETYFKRALEMYEKSVGPEHPETAKAQKNLAMLYRMKRDYRKSEQMYERARAVYEKTFGAEHRNTRKLLVDWTILHAVSGDIAKAIEVMAKATEISERHLALVIAAGSEDQKREFVATFADETDVILSLHLRLAPGNPEAAQMAMTTILRRKGRILDAMADSIGAVRRRLDPEGQAALNELSAARSRLAKLVIAGPGAGGSAQWQEEAQKLSAEVTRLEAAVSARSAEFGVQTQTATIENVRKMIPADAALVEIAAWRPFNPEGKSYDTSYGSERYVAYILRREGALSYVELGEVSEIEPDVARFRTALSTPYSRNVKEAARALDEKIMRPVRKLLGETRRVMLSPDGILNLVPFGALADEQNRYLIESYSLSYLTSGRDLLRFQLNSPERQGAMVIADPQFNASAAARNRRQASPGSHPSSIRRFPASAVMSFRPLPGAESEARSLAEILPGARVLTGPRATEARLKRLAGPRLLHIATHGFFLDDASLKSGQGQQQGQGANNPQPPGGAIFENPLLRSGIALAGANQLKGGGDEDGILTALEASGLDLWGTKLVVLSACETGVGKAQSGDGVYGLRRALLLAGAECEVMSLWKVDDQATRDLMVEYYQELQRGEGRGESLRRAQIGLMRKPEKAGSEQRGSRLAGQAAAGASKAGRDHPYYWASFIQLGRWDGLKTAR